LHVTASSCRIARLDTELTRISHGRPLPAWRFEDYLGWSEQGDGKLAYGLFIQNGRIKGEMKKALRKVWLFAGIRRGI